MAKTKSKGHRKSKARASQPVAPFDEKGLRAADGSNPRKRPREEEDDDTGPTWTCGKCRSVEQIHPPESSDLEPNQRVTCTLCHKHFHHNNVHTCSQYSDEEICHLFVDEKFFKCIKCCPQPGLASLASLATSPNPANTHGDAPAASATSTPRADRRTRQASRRGLSRGVIDAIMQDSDGELADTSTSSLDNNDVQDADFVPSVDCHNENQKTCLIIHSLIWM